MNSEKDSPNLTNSTRSKGGESEEFKNEQGYDSSSCNTWSDFHESNEVLTAGRSESKVQSLGKNELHTKAKD